MNLSDITQLDTLPRAREEREKGWTNQLMQDDPLFSELNRNRRFRVHDTQIFVAWERHDSKPRIRALIRINNTLLNVRHGIRLDATISAPEPQGVQEIRIDHKPQRILDLDLYFWVPAHSDVVFSPVNVHRPDGPRVLYVELMTRMRARPDQDHKEGLLYCNTVQEFSKLWPQHAF